jgi:hypothetical protein
VCAQIASEKVAINQEDFAVLEPVFSKHIRSVDLKVVPRLDYVAANSGY